MKKMTKFFALALLAGAMVSCSTEDTAPTVIRIVPYGKENEDWNEDDWEDEWNNAPDENEDE